MNRVFPLKQWSRSQGVKGSSERKAIEDFGYISDV